MDLDFNNLRPSWIRLRLLVKILENSIKALPKKCHKMTRTKNPRNLPNLTLFWKITTRLAKSLGWDSWPLGTDNLHVKKGHTEMK
jgi:hypothetical protein